MSGIYVIPNANQGNLPLRDVLDAVAVTNTMIKKKHVQKLFSHVPGPQYKWLQALDECMWNNVDYWLHVIVLCNPLSYNTRNT